MHDTITPRGIANSEVAERRHGSVLLRHVSWEGYQALLREVGDDAARMTYDDGYLEIEVPGKRHEELKKLAAAIVEAMLNAKRINYAPLGSTTWNRPEKLKGLEADECYYIGAAADVIHSLDRIDLSADPPPNIALEIDVTARSIDKLQVYAAMGIIEVWRIDEHVNVFISRVRRIGRLRTRADKSAAPRAQACGAR